MPLDGWITLKPNLVLGGTELTEEDEFRYLGRSSHNGLSAFAHTEGSIVTYQCEASVASARDPIATKF